MPRFLTPVGVIGAAANGGLTVGTDTTGPTGGMWFGSDTNFYRLSPGVIRTDGALNVGIRVDALQGFRHGGPSLPSWTSGAGSPEGVVTAPVGSMWSRTDGGTGTAVYRKETGTGNTGWVAVAAAPADAVTSVDGRTGVVTLADLYVNVTGDTMTGALRVGTPAAGFPAAVDVGITGLHRGQTEWSNLSIVSSDAAAVDKGGSLSLGGSYTGTSPTVFARIATGKENAVDGEYGGYLWFGTRPNGSSMAQRMRIASTGEVSIFGTTTVTPVHTTWGVNRYGVDSQAYANIATAEGTYGVMGIQARGIKQGAGALTSTSGVRGVSAFADVDGTGNVTEAIGIETGARNLNATATLTSAIGLRVESAGSGSNLITNTTGVTIKNQGRTGTAAAIGLNVHAQTGAATINVGAQIGAASTFTLLVGSDVDSTTAAGGISFGTSKDTNLYRSAANNLKTDDTFNAPTVVANDYRLLDAPRHSVIGAFANESIVPLVANTWADRFQHATIQAAEYWTGSAWTAFPSIDTVKQVFSGYPGTTGAALNSTTYPKWRVSFSGMSASYAAMLQIYQEFGPPKGYKVTLEESADNVAWVTLLAETTVVDGIYYSLIPTTVSYGAYVRVTIEHTTAANVYQWRNIRFLSDRCNGQGGQQLGLPFSWDYDKGITFAGLVSSSVGFAAGTNPAAAGAIRLANNANISWRNAANTADIAAVNVDATNALNLTAGANGYLKLGATSVLRWNATQLIVSDGVNFSFDTTTGTKIGVTPLQKIGFFNATPIVQPSNTTDLRQALINLGLYATGGATPLNLNGGALTAATAALGTNPATSGTIGLPNGAGGAINFRTADNTANATGIWLGTNNVLQISAAGLAANLAGASLTMADGLIIGLGTTTGTKFGTATTQKMGWWNATPVVQNTGWTATAGYTALKAFNPATTTLAETARVLGTLIDALKSYGLLG